MNKKKIKIEIQETLSEVLEIEANDINEALSIAKKMYNEEKIILGEQNHINTEFNVLK